MYRMPAWLEKNNLIDKTLSSALFINLFHLTLRFKRGLIFPASLSRFTLYSVSVTLKQRIRRNISSSLWNWIRNCSRKQKIYSLSFHTAQATWVSGRVPFFATWCFLVNDWTEICIKRVDNRDRNCRTIRLYKGTHQYNTSLSRRYYIEMWLTIDLWNIFYLNFFNLIMDIQLTSVFMRRPSAMAS